MVVIFWSFNFFFFWQVNIHLSRVSPLSLPSFPGLGPHGRRGLWGRYSAFKPLLEYDGLWSWASGVCAEVWPAWRAFGEWGTASKIFFFSFEFKYLHFLPGGSTSLICMYGSLQIPLFFQPLETPGQWGGSQDLSAAWPHQAGHPESARQHASSPRSLCHPFLNHRWETIMLLPCCTEIEELAEFPRFPRFALRSKGQVALIQSFLLNLKVSTSCLWPEGHSWLGGYSFHLFLLPLFL